ncbi:MAG: hypothetical protein KME40_09080 [Komarekiella atlantica HA4396-MV6]|jgi:hypothetical protein|nr:hypothetical protein [Komarekiella atlantica HA4396-MV6]
MTITVKLPSYQIYEQIHVGDKTLVYRGVRKQERSLPLNLHNEIYAIAIQLLLNDSWLQQYKLTFKIYK